MTSQTAFMAACAPDHPEIHAILAFLDQVLPPADGDPLHLLRRIQAAVMLLLAARLESRLLTALDQDQQTLPSAALIRQAARARRDAMALLESLLRAEPPPQPPHPEPRPAGADPANPAPPLHPPASAVEPREQPRTGRPASASASDTRPLDAPAGGPALLIPPKGPALPEKPDRNHRSPDTPPADRLPSLSAHPAGAPPPHTAGAACSSAKPAAPDRVSSPYTPQQDKNTNLATRPSPSPSAGTTVPDRAKNSPPDHRDTTHLPLRNGHTRR